MDGHEVVKYENLYKELNVIKNKVKHLNFDIEKLDELIKKNINIDNNSLNEKSIKRIGKNLEDVLQNVDNSIISINSKLNP